MPVIAIITKIRAGIKSYEDNRIRAKALTRYCLNPGSSRGGEKCVCAKAFNFSDDDPSLDWIQFELEHDMMRCRYQDNELLSHWVISFRDEYPDEEVIMGAAHDLLSDLGYGDDRKYIVAVHADTEHVHAHICACRVDPWTGRLVQEGNRWWKNESQKSLARMAHKYGWTLAPEAKYRVPANPRKEIVECHMPDGSIKEMLRPKVERMHEEKGVSLRYGERKKEKHTGLKSGQRLLQEALKKFLDEHGKDFPKWKVGNFHKELARIGIACERVKHGDKYGLVFSMEDGVYESASSVCPELTYEKLMKRIGAKGWRDAREEYGRILAEAREGREGLAADSDKEAPQPESASLAELTCDQRKLRGFLLQFMEENRDEFGGWRFGHFHRALAEKGIACERVQTDDGYRLFYTIYDDAREPASLVCPEMEYDALCGMIGGQSWRDAREEHRRILVEARQALPTASRPSEPEPDSPDGWSDADESHKQVMEHARSERSPLPEPLPQEKEKMRYGKGALDAMRRIPTDEVFAALGMEPKTVRPNGKPVKTAFDACFCAGHTYAQAADFLAERFPEVLETPDQGDPVDIMIEAVKEQGIDPGKLERNAREIGKFMFGLKVDELDIMTGIPVELWEERRAQGKRLENFRDGEGLSFGRIVRSLPILAELSMAGKPGVMPVGVFCRPVWPQGKIGIMVDCPNAGFLNAHPPTLLMSTGERSSHAFYALPRKYPEPFYDELAAYLNGKWGSGKVGDARHPAMLPGFQNQEDDPAFWVRVKEWTRAACRSMIDLADRLFPKWLKANAPALSASRDAEEIWREASAEVWRKIGPRRRSLTQAKITEMIMERVRALDLEAEAEIRERLISTRWGKYNYFCPPDLEVIGCQEQAKLKEAHGSGFYPRRIGEMVADRLYEAGAKPGQVQAWLLVHMLGEEEKGRLGADRLERLARRIAVKHAPVSALLSNSEFRKMIEPARGPGVDHAPLDPERDRKAQVDELRTRPRLKESPDEPPKEERKDGLD